MPDKWAAHVPRGYVHAGGRSTRIHGGREDLFWGEVAWDVCSLTAIHVLRDADPAYVRDLWRHGSGR